MKKTKHIQGPWYYYNNLVMDKPWLGPDPLGYRTGEIPDLVIAARTNEQARFIAAAPKLLKALHTLANALPCGHGINSDIIDQVNEAISEATGV